MRLDIAGGGGEPPRGRSINQCGIAMALEEEEGIEVGIEGGADVGRGWW